MVILLIRLMLGRELLPYYRKTIYSGDVVEIEEYFSLRKRGESVPRSTNQNFTPKQLEEMNYQKSIKNLSRLINTNFKTGDYFITLTHRRACSEDEALHERTLFLRRLRNFTKKSGFILKYIGVTEGITDNKRMHHHFIINNFNNLPVNNVDIVDTVMNLWKAGRVMFSKLDNFADYTGLARYVTKEGHIKNKKRWIQSKNLAKPVEKIKVLKRKTILKPPAGYKVLFQQMFISDISGEMQYLKAIRIGGIDYGGVG